MEYLAKAAGKQLTRLKKLYKDPVQRVSSDSNVTPFSKAHAVNIQTPPLLLLSQGDPTEPGIQYECQNGHQVHPAPPPSPSKRTRRHSAQNAVTNIRKMLELLMT